MALLASAGRRLAQVAARPGACALHSSAPAAGGMGLPIQYAPAPKKPFPEEAEIKHWYSGCIHPEPLFDFCEPLVTLPQALFQNAIAFSIVPLAGYLAYWSIKASPKQFTDREPMLPEDVAKARKAVGVHNEHA